LQRPPRAFVAFPTCRRGMANPLQLAFMRCMGCGFELAESKASEAFFEPTAADSDPPRPKTWLSKREVGPWWAEPTAASEFESAPPTQPAGDTAEMEPVANPRCTTEFLGPHVTQPPRLPLPLVDEDSAHWPADEPSPKKWPEATAAKPAEDPKELEQSPNPCKEFRGSSTVSTRSSGSRFASSSSGSMRSSSVSLRSSGGLEEERRPIVCPAIKWRISIDKNETEASLGVDLVDLPCTKDRDGALRVEKVHVPGLVSEWNAAHRNKEVKKGDYIVEVNGVHGGSEELREVVERHTFLDIMLLRGT